MIQSDLNILKEYIFSRKLMKLNWREIIIGYYFHSYGSGCDRGPSFCKKVAEQFLPIPSHSLILQHLMPTWRSAKNCACIKPENHHILLDSAVTFVPGIGVENLCGRYKHCLQWGCLLYFPSFSYYPLFLTPSVLYHLLSIILHHSSSSSIINHLSLSSIYHFYPPSIILIHSFIPWAYIIFHVPLFFTDLYHHLLLHPQLLYIFSILTQHD